MGSRSFVALPQPEVLATHSTTTSKPQKDTFQATLFDYVGEAHRGDYWGVEDALMFNGVTSNFEVAPFCIIEPPEAEKSTLPDDADVVFMPVSYEYIRRLRSKQPIYIQSESTKLIFPSGKYVDFLSHVLDLPVSVALNQAMPVVSGFIKYWDAHLGTYIFKPNVSRASRFNPYSNLQSARVSAIRLADFLSRVAKYVYRYRAKHRTTYSINITLTFPKEFSLRLIDDYEGTLETAKAVFDTFMQILSRKFLKSDNEMLGYARNTHLIGSKNPFSPHLHHHLTLINLVMREDKETGEIVFKRFSPVMNVEELRRMWKSALAQHGIYVEGDVDVHTEYVKIPIRLDEDGRFRHWVKYASRKFTVDIANYLNENSEIPQFAKSFMRNVLSYRNQRVNYGWLRKQSYIEEKLSTISISSYDDDVPPPEDVEAEDFNNPKLRLSAMPTRVDSVPWYVRRFVQHNGEWYEILPSSSSIWFNPRPPPPYRKVRVVHPHRYG